MQSAGGCGAFFSGDFTAGAGVCDVRGKDRGSFAFLNAWVSASCGVFGELPMMPPGSQQSLHISPSMRKDETA
jgi:hypothetical protein